MMIIKRAQINKEARKLAELESITFFEALKRVIKCSKCDERDINNFHRNKSNKNGLQNQCKACVAKNYLSNKNKSNTISARIVNGRIKNAYNTLCEKCKMFPVFEYVVQANDETKGYCYSCL